MSKAQISVGSTWLSKKADQLAENFGIPGSIFTWGPDGEGFTSGKRTLTLGLRGKQVPFVVLERDLEDVPGSKKIRARLLIQLRQAMLPFVHSAARSKTPPEEAQAPNPVAQKKS